MGVFICSFNLPLSEVQAAFKFLSVIQVMQRYAAVASNFKHLSIEYLLVHYWTEKVASKLDCTLSPQAFFL